MKIIYEPHPVSKARKHELRALGYRIIDAKFAPEDAQADVPEPQEPEQPARKRGRKASEQTEENE